MRVRAEGESFLLQAQDQRGVMNLLEAVHAATNVSLDLDDRHLPVLQTLPRQRRRFVQPPLDGGQIASGLVVGSQPRREQRSGW